MAKKSPIVATKSTSVASEPKSSKDVQHINSTVAPKKTTSTSSRQPVRSSKSETVAKQAVVTPSSTKSATPVSKNVSAINKVEKEAIVVEELPLVQQWRNAREDRQKYIEDIQKDIETIRENTDEFIKAIREERRERGLDLRKYLASEINKIRAQTEAIHKKVWG